MKKRYLTLLICYLFVPFLAKAQLYIYGPAEKDYAAYLFAYN